MIILILLTVISCNSKRTKFKDTQDFNEYINNTENGFISSVESKDFIFISKLSPPIVNDSFPQITIQFRIKRKDGGSVLEFGNVNQNEILMREGYLSFGVENDVYLESKSYKSPLLFNHYERNYGLKPSIDMFFRFKSIEATEDVSLYFEDKLFNQGLIKIDFNKELFNKCYVEE